MEKIKIFILLILGTFTLESMAKTTGNSSITENSKALQFQIGSNFTLTSFQGSAFSIKYHLKPDMAIRIGIDLDLNNESSDKNLNSSDDNGYLSKKIINYDAYDYKFRLNTHVLWYSISAYGIYFFYGVGPFLSVKLLNQKYTETSTLLNNPETVNKGETKEKEFSLGITGVGGVEWFVSNSISIHTEYSLSGAYNWYKKKITTNQKTSPNISETQETRNYLTATGNGVRFGLSIYF